MNKRINITIIFLFVVISQGLHSQVKELHNFHAGNINQITPEQIFQAVEYDSRVLDLIAENNVSIDVVDEKGESPLFKASLGNRTDLVELLLNLTELPITQKTESGKDLADVALSNNNLAVCQILLDRGYPKSEMESRIPISNYRPHIITTYNFLKENNMKIIASFKQELLNYVNNRELPHPGFLPLGWNSEGKLAFLSLGSSEMNFSVIDTVTDEIIHAIPEGTQDFSRRDTSSQTRLGDDRFYEAIHFLENHEDSIDRILNQLEIQPLNNDFSRNELYRPVLIEDDEFYPYYLADSASSLEGGIYVFNPERGTKRITWASHPDRPVGGIKNHLGPNLAIIVESETGYYITGCLLNKGFTLSQWDIKKGMLIEKLSSESLRFLFLGRTPDNEAVYMGHNGEGFYLANKGLPLGNCNTTSPLELFLENQIDFHRLFEEEGVHINPRDDNYPEIHSLTYETIQNFGYGAYEEPNLILMKDDDFYMVPNFHFDFESPYSKIDPLFAVSFDFCDSVYLSFKINLSPEEENRIRDMDIGVVKEGYYYWSVKKDDLYLLDYNPLMQRDPYDDDYDYMGEDEHPYL